MDSLRNENRSGATGFTALVLLLLMVTIGVSLLAPQQIKLVYWAPFPSPYDVGK